MSEPNESPSPGGAPGPADRIADRILRGPLSLALVALMIAQIALWAPSYLSWPWWNDHDVFAAMGRAWSLGVLPYRGFYTNNLPGATYLHLLSGTLFGWGKTWGFYAIDVGFVVALGMAMLCWSRRVIGWFAPGAVGILIFLAFYPSLDYSVAAERDFHATFFAVLAVLILQSSPGRLARIFAAAAFILAALVLALGLAGTFNPAFVSPGAIRAFKDFRKDRLPFEPPDGYAKHIANPGAAFYRWQDYRGAIEYLRTSTDRRTRVANLLLMFPAVVAPADRLSTFPAESLGWLNILPDDAADFVARFERDPDCVAVWSPAEAEPGFAADHGGGPDLAPFVRILRRDFEPLARFGAIEIWGRKRPPNGDAPAPSR